MPKAVGPPSRLGTVPATRTSPSVIVRPPKTGSHSIGHPLSDLLPGVAAGESWGPEPPPPQKPKYVILLRIQSNYGSPRGVACCEIDVLGANQAPIPVHSLFLKSPQHFTTDIGKLLDGRMRNEEQENLWEIPLVPEPGGPSIDLQFTLFSDDPPTAIRFWHSRVDQTKNIRQIEVYVNGHAVFQGELNNLFGSVVQLGSDFIERPTVAMGGSEDPECTRDEFGDYPIVRFQSIEFVVEETRDPKSERFALGRFAIYGLDGTPVVVEKASFGLANCTECDVPSQLFAQRRNAYGPIPACWVGKFTGEGRPRISARFENWMRAACIQIIQEESDEPSPASVVTKLRINLDGKSVWSGRVAGKAPKTGLEPIATYAFLVGCPTIKETILRLGKTPPSARPGLDV